jgi:hypothetical protein
MTVWSNLRSCHSYLSRDGPGRPTVREASNQPNWESTFEFDATVYYEALHRKHSTTYQPILLGSTEVDVSLPAIWPIRNWNLAELQCEPFFLYIRVLSGGLKVTNRITKKKSLVRQTFKLDGSEALKNIENAEKNQGEVII